MSIEAPFSGRVAALVLISFALAWTGGCTQKSNTKTGAPAAVPVRAQVARRGDVSITETEIGSVQAVRTVSLKSQVDGVIERIAFREGDEVEAGTVLVTLDRRPFENSLRTAQADLDNAKAQLAQAEADEQRYEHLDAQAVVSKEELLQYRTRAQSARAALAAKEADAKNAELQLSYTEIRAPISGRTGQLGLHEGALVKANDAGQAIVTLNQLSPISVAFAVPESELSRIQQALKAGPVRVTATAHSTANGQSVAEGKLDFVDNSVDPTTGTITLKATIENADRSLWPGEFVDTTTYVGQENGVVLIRTSAVQVGQQGGQVFVVKSDRTVDLRRVKTGRLFNADIVILQGVEAGETVVVDGQLRLVPGSLVEVKAEDGASPTTAAEKAGVTSEHDSKS